MRWYELVLESRATLEEIKSRAEAAGVEMESREDGLLMRDPAGNRVLLKVL